MVEELWCHAVRFLDMYRTGDHSGHIGQLYQFADQTGILETHRQCLAQPYEDSQVDMKIMYYELIRMMTNYERENCKDPELYDSTKSVGKIEGYQELTNKLQRFLNQRFILDIEELNKKHAGDNIAIYGDQNINQKIDELEKSFNILAANNKILSESCASLENKNEILEGEIETLKEKILEPQDNKEGTPMATDLVLTSNLEKPDAECEAADGEFPALFFSNKIDVQNEAISKLDDKIQKMINQASTILINDATHLERISILESKGREFDRKLSNLESADLYLQESHRMVTERTSLVEKYSKYVEEKVNSLTIQKQEDVLSKPSNYHNSNFKQEKTESRLASLENSVLFLQSKSKVKEDNDEVLKFGSVLNTIQNRNTTTVTEIERKENTLKSEITETSKNLYIVGKDHNKNVPNHSELLDKYKKVLSKVEKMENLLDQQAQHLSDCSGLFSEEYFKLLVENVNKTNEKESVKLCKETFSEKFENSTHLEIHSKEVLDKNAAKDIRFIWAEVENIKIHLQFYCQNLSILRTCQVENSNGLANLEKDFLGLFGKSESYSSIFEFIDIVVGMNKSLNQMMHDLVKSQSQLHLLRNEQEEVLMKIGEQKKILKSHNDSFDRVFRNMRSADIKEISDYELVSQKTQDMENIVKVMKEKVDELEKIDRRSNPASEDGFTVVPYTGSNRNLKRKGLNNARRNGSNRKLANWFAKQHGAGCC